MAIATVSINPSLGMTNETRGKGEKSGEGEETSTDYARSVLDGQ